MKRPAWRDDGAEAAALLELARSTQPLERSDELASEQRFARAFREHVVEQDRRGWSTKLIWSWRHGLALAGALALVLAVFQLGTQFGAPPLSYRVGRSEATGERRIQTAQEPVALEFSDGTVVTVEPGTLARVQETTERGARFRLDSGRMSFNVVPHPERGLWSVDAGPFRVRVTGTVFTVEWHAADGSLRVDVTRGRVVVEGAGQRRELGPGDSFQHREATATAPTGSAAPAAPSSQGDGPDAPTTPAVLPSTRSAAKIERWSSLVAVGDYGAVVAAARQRGFQSCFDGCAREDLAALADAARLGGHNSLAERALLAQRARFRASEEAAAAAFLLGRSAEERQSGQALAWYDTYLVEAPRGRFAADALGRKMMLLAKSSAGRATALALAQRYLERFPQGSYAPHARSLVEAGDERR